MEGRRKERNPERLQVLLSSLADPLAKELASTENISSYGMPVQAGRAWKPETGLMVKSSHGQLWAGARVVYCQALPARTFALGLEFLVRTGDWTHPGMRPDTIL